MTDRERFINCALNKPIDRTPFCFYFGPWPETIERWKRESGKGENAWREGLGFDDSIQTIGIHVNHLHYPPFEMKILERRGEKIVYQDSLGEIVESIDTKVNGFIEIPPCSAAVVL